MRSRDKVVLSIFGLTLIIGTLAVGVMFSAPTDMRYLRWQIAQGFADFLADPAQAFADFSKLSQWVYVGLALIATVAIVALLRALRDRESLALKQRLGAMTLAKQETDHLLIQERTRSKQDRNVKDAALRDLDLALERIESLFGELREKENLVKERDRALLALREELALVSARLAKRDVGNLPS